MMTDTIDQDAWDALAALAQLHATSDCSDRIQPSRSLGVSRTSSPSSAGETKGDSAMISTETRTSQLLRMTAHLLNSIDLASWTSDTHQRRGGTLHRIGTDAHPDILDILDMLGRP